MLSKIKAASQAPKKTLKLSTLVSSLLQVYPSPIFNCGNRVHGPEFDCGAGQERLYQEAVGAKIAAREILRSAPRDGRLAS
jgi:hypothetical protein